MIVYVTVCDCLRVSFCVTVCVTVSCVPRGTCSPAAVAAATAPPPLQVALEFHKMRDRYPEFFQSQIGNKIMYGGVSKQARVRG